MPFISKDWRSPGEEWVKTDEGWEKKKILECVTSYGQNVTRSPKTSTSSEEDCCDTLPQTWSSFEDKENVVPTSPINNDGAGLPPHCFIVIKSTREIAGFNGLSDALKRLDFRAAVQDQRRFNYICKLLDILVSDKLASLSGCAQKVLFNVLEEVAYHVSKSGQNPEVLRKLLLQLRCLVDCACWGRPIGSTALWRAHLETINRIFNIADTLSLSQPDVVPSFLELPEECVREVMLRLADHKDLESCRAASDIMSRLFDETRLWRELTKFHFTQPQIDIALADMPQEQNIDWAALYHKLRKKHGLREDYAEMVHLCRICRCLFWAGSGHPCIQTDKQATGQDGKPSEETKETTEEGQSDLQRNTLDPLSHIPVPPHAFLKFFSL